VVGFGRVRRVSDGSDLKDREAEAAESPCRGDHPAGLHLYAEELASPGRLQPAPELVIRDNLVHTHHGPADPQYGPPVLRPVVLLARVLERFLADTGLDVVAQLLVDLPGSRTDARFSGSIRRGNSAGRQIVDRRRHDHVPLTDVLLREA